MYMKTNVEYWKHNSFLFTPIENSRNGKKVLFTFRKSTKVGNLKGYLFWPPFLKVFCQKWKFGRAKEMSALAGI